MSKRFDIPTASKAMSKRFDMAERIRAITRVSVEITQQAFSRQNETTFSGRRS